MFYSGCWRLHCSFRKSQSVPPAEAGSEQKNIEEARRDAGLEGQLYRNFGVPSGSWIVTTYAPSESIFQ